MLWAHAPGEGPKAQRGYDEARPIISALEAWKQNKGSYPTNLAELVPSYLRRLPDFDFSYSNDAQSYTLLFSYAEAGMNDCVYTPTTKWRCSGYL